MINKRINNYDMKIIKGRYKNREVILNEIRDLGRNDITNFLRENNVLFIVANLGHPLKWIPESQTYSFWKEVKDKIIEVNEADNGFLLANYPHQYCYLASEWNENTKTVDKSFILLKMIH